MSLQNYQITKFFLTGPFEGLTLVDSLVNHDPVLGDPFRIGQVVETQGGHSYRVVEVKGVGGPSDDRDYGPAAHEDPDVQYERHLEDLGNTWNSQLEDEIELGFEDQYWEDVRRAQGA